MNTKQTGQFTQEEIEQIRKAKREYMREYRKRKGVKEKMKAEQQRYWLKKSREMTKEAEGGE